MSEITDKPHRQAEAIDLYIRHLEAQAAGDWSAAKALLEASAKLGEPMAMHAAAYQEANLEAAVALYIAAANAGYAPSAWNLYLHFEESGDGAEAARWLERAASLGDEDAIKLLK